LQPPPPPGLAKSKGGFAKLCIKFWLRTWYRYSEHIWNLLII
jgi:hypothetical protein